MLHVYIGTCTTDCSRVSLEFWWSTKMRYWWIRKEMVREMLQPLHIHNYTVPSNKQRANKMYTAKPWLKILRHTVKEREIVFRVLVWDDCRASVLPFCGGQSTAGYQWCPEQRVSRPGGAPLTTSPALTAGGRKDGRGWEFEKKSENKGWEVEFRLRVTQHLPLPEICS